ncbi:MAG: acetyl-CoA carboxylase biotin carboxylase subunit [Candidatus Stahlbacteria bacterium]|nr:acetyl-CoA carboxylase biotin carboxylase subunit [Candidatus Stahlbacteria bacterium]
MLKKVLIANRGEIAIRIIRACKELGIETVAIYSEGDISSLHTKFADESVCVGPTPPDLSYLSIPHIISACEVTGVEAVHPGYGFLSENPRFAEICEENGFKFIGPSPYSVRLAGDKLNARNEMKKVGIPVIPGSDGPINSIEEAIKIAENIGYPVIIKAALGGGGRGMRIANNKEELENSLPIAKGEAKTAFGDDKVYLEKYFISPRHIEVQILADDYNNIIWLGERECSIQRRHQKLIEEAPSPGITQKQREEIGNYAVMAAKSISYRSAGTVEFLFDANNKFYFMEINSRIQVEHPVTEMVTGIDIVKEQLKIAAGEEIKIKQSEIKIKGHAMECRINAEDYKNGFLPSPGKVNGLYLPGGPGIRVDTHLYSGYYVPPNYDSLIAKLIVHGETRSECIARMERALVEFLIEGIHTTIPFHQEIIKDERFRRGELHTHFLNPK